MRVSEDLHKVAWGSMLVSSSAALTYDAVVRTQDVTIAGDLQRICGICNDHDRLHSQMSQLLCCCAMSLRQESKSYRQCAKPHIKLSEVFVHSPVLGQLDSCAGELARMLN